MFTGEITWGRMGGLIVLLCVAMGCVTGNGAKVVEDAVTVPNTALGMKAPEPGESALSEASVEPRDFTVEPYRIGPGDVLNFQSFNEGLMGGPVVVRYDGHISLPLIPDIKVQGLTRDEATEKVREAYTKEFREPRVSLTIESSTSKVFHVMGDITRPGEYAYTRPISLLEAINNSGGVRESQRSRSGNYSLASQSQLRKAFIIRAQEGKRDVMGFDLRGLENTGPHPGDTPIYPGDVIYVPDTVALAYVMGAVRQPSAYEIAEGMTLIELLALAGGPIEVTGRMRQVVLLRAANDVETRIMLVNMRAILKGREMPPVIEPGDIIYVPQKRLVRAAQFVSNANSVIAPNLQLYMQTYDAIYTDRRYRQLINSSSAANGTLLTLEQMIRNIGTISNIATGLP